tara:strand:+ start:1753 stop:1959 length:207 start_codon:yes stop_codon:yes gene_type:complete
MRILNIINNELVTQKLKLEHELERVLNLTTDTTEEKLDVCTKLIDKLTQSNANISTWETYINKEKENK